MEEKVTIARVEISREDWEQTPARVKELVRHLEERLGLTSKNSSQPPSSDPPKPKKDTQGKKKRGGQKGHKGFSRYLYDESECREVISHKPQHCGHCQSALTGEDPNPYRHQIVEIPPVELDIIEHQLHSLECLCCGKKTRASLPASVNPRGYGERLQAIVGLLSGGYRLSHQNLKTLLWELWGIRISVASLNRLRQTLSQKVLPAVAEARAYVQAAPVTHADETGWKQHDGDGSNPEQKSAWLWVAACEFVTVYQLTLSRSGNSARQLLGAESSGIVVSDRYGAYNWLELEHRQICWAHLKRDFVRMSERSGASGEIGRALLQQTRKLFRWWHRVRDGTLSRELFEKAIGFVRSTVKRLLEEAVDLCDSLQEKTPLGKTARTCAQILKVEPALWTFVEHLEVEPTNNTAERALRTAVIWRRLSFGSQSAAGSEFVARLLTVVTSLRAQGRSVLDFLVEALRDRQPSLLPLPPE